MLASQAGRGVGATEVRPAALSERVCSTTFVQDGVLRGMVAARLPLGTISTYLGRSCEAVLDDVVRLGLPTPIDKPLRKITKLGWTVEDIQRLILWRPAGVHPDVIGQNLSRVRSANAVRAKARRLGIMPPPRKSLFRPLQEQLSLSFFAADSLPHGSAMPNDGGPATLRPGELAHGTPSSDAPDFKIPSAIEDVDFTDLTWVGSLRGRRGRPGAALHGVSTNKAAVYAIGVVACAAVDRFRAAEILGLSVAAYRTQRTRLGLPRIDGRSAFTHLFDVEVGLETIKRGNLEVVASMHRTDGQAPQYFWRYRDERHVRFAPSERVQRARGEPTYSRPVSICTRAILDAEAMSAPKAENQHKPLLFRSPRPADGNTPTMHFPLPAAPFATGHASL